MKGWLGTAFAAMESPSFRVIWAGTLAAFVGLFMALALQAILAFDLTGNNRTVGLVVAMQGVAQLTLSPFAGVVADRFSKRLTLLVCQSLMVAVVAALAALLAADRLTVGALAGGSLLFGAAFSFIVPARYGLMAGLVRREHRPNAVALNQVAQTLARVAAPVAVGAIIAVDWLGSTGAYLIMAVLCAIAVATTVTLPDVANADGPRRAMLGEMTDGWRYAWRDPRVRTILAAFIVAIAFGFPHQSLLPGLARHEFGRPAKAITLMLGTAAFGGFVASLAAAAFASARRVHWLFAGFGVLFGISLVALGLSPTYWTAVACMFVVGVGSSGFQGLSGAMFSEICEPEVFGRVISLTGLAFGASALVAFPAGALADRLGERETLVLMGLGVATVNVLFAAVSVRAGLGRAPVLVAAVTPDSVSSD